MTGRTAGRAESSAGPHWLGTQNAGSHSLQGAATQVVSVLSLTGEAVWRATVTARPTAGLSTRSVQQMSVCRQLVYGRMKRLPLAPGAWPSDHVSSCMEQVRNQTETPPRIDPVRAPEAPEWPA